MRRPKTPLKLELPLILFLGFFWMVVWQSFEVGTFILGVVYGAIVVRVFYLPPLRRSGRINPFWGLVQMTRFLGKMFIASFQVSWLAVVKGPRIRNSIIGIQLRSHDDLITTLTGHFLALVPGSLVVDVDRTTGSLYLHVINITDDAAAEAIRNDALRTEKLFIRTLGNPSDLAVVKAESRLKRTASLSKAERDTPPVAGGRAPGAQLPRLPQSVADPSGREQTP
ncbi:MAG: Na+/H+ antiporter subunit E [Nesterenkonia sp.]